MRKNLPMLGVAGVLLVLSAVIGFRTVVIVKMSLTWVGDQVPPGAPDTEALRDGAIRGLARACGLPPLFLAAAWALFALTLLGRELRRGRRAANGGRADPPAQ